MMGADRRYWKLFVRYLAGECSEREEAEVRAIIAVDDDRGRLFDDLQRIWRTPAHVKKDRDDAAAWAEVERKLSQGPRITNLASAREPVARRASSRTTRIPHSGLWTAAVIVVVVIGTVLAVDPPVTSQMSGAEPDLQVFTTQRGERATVRLPDGSRILLNADSRLTVPYDFQDGDRAVQFEGQGFFNVTSDEESPFVVHTELADIEVLGTEFDVHAYPNAQQMQVIVASGEVSVRSNHSDRAERIHLKPHDLGLVLLTGGQLVRRNINVDPYLAWREGRLTFENASFDEVRAELERWYDLEVKQSRDSMAVDGLTASFRNESVDQVLDVVSAALNLTYRREGRTVTFYAAR